MGNYNAPKEAHSLLMFKIAILLFAALVRGLTERNVTESFDAIANGPPGVATVECLQGIDWGDSRVETEPGSGSHGDPYYAVLVGGGSDANPSADCYVKLALFEKGFWSPTTYIQIAASAATDSTDLQIGNLACTAASTDACVADFGVAYHLPKLVGLSDNDVSTAVWCPGFEGALPGDGSGDAYNPIWAYLDSSVVEDCRRVWRFESKWVVVAGTLSKSDDGITLQIPQNDCATISCTDLTDYAEWSSASYEPSTTQAPDITTATVDGLTTATVDGLTTATVDGLTTTTTVDDDTTTTADDDTTTPVDDTTTPIEGTTTPVDDATTSTPETEPTTSAKTIEADSTFFAAVGFTLLALVA